MKLSDNKLFALVVFLLCVLIVVVGVACSDADTARLYSQGSSHHIKQFSGGQLVGEWDSTGIVETEHQSDGYFFEDKKTKKIVLVSGDLQITVN